MPVVPTEPPDKLNELVRKSADEIFKWVKKQHDDKLLDSMFKNDPITHSLNAYSLTMNYCIALMHMVIDRALDMQANYEDPRNKHDS